MSHTPRLSRTRSFLFLSRLRTQLRYKSFTIFVHLIVGLSLLLDSEVWLEAYQRCRTLRDYRERAHFCSYRVSGGTQLTCKSLTTFVHSIVGLSLLLDPELSSVIILSPMCSGILKFLREYREHARFRQQQRQASRDSSLLTFIEASFFRYG